MLRRSYLLELKEFYSAKCTVEKAIVNVDEGKDLFKSDKARQRSKKTLQTLLTKINKSLND